MADKGTIVKITIDVGKGEKVVEINPSKLPLVFLEALDEVQESKSFRHMRKGIQKLLSLTEEESYELDTDHIRLITEAITAAQNIPNG